MQKRGHKASSKVLSLEVERINDKLCNKLHCSKREKIVKLKRVRCADGNPLALQIAAIRRKFCPGLEEVDLTNQSLYKTLEEKFNVVISKASQEIEARTASKSEAKYLKIEEGDTVLIVRRTVYKENGDLIEFTRSIYRSDQYTLFVSLHR